MKNLWEKYSDEEKKSIQDFCEGYRDFLSTHKTEREFVDYAVEEAEKQGFKSLESVISSGKKLSAGDKVYAVYMNKTIATFVLGTEPLEKGMLITAAHIDSPRLDIKQKPLYESQGFCMMDTHYYGGIKKYQWTALPLALHGVICKKDGTTKKVVFGEDENGPVIGLSDLLPHLEKKDDKKDFSGEDLNLLIGNTPANVEKDKFKTFIINLLKEKGIDEQDFLSAEIEVVPSGKARNFGLDNSMIMAYGQDDRVCGYTSLKSIFEVENPKYTCVSLLVDKEEIGSVGATGMQSKFFENVVAEIMNAQGDYSELKVRRTMQNSATLSSDVTGAVDPNFTSPYNTETDAHFARGVNFNKYTGHRGKYESNDANPEFIAKLRDCFDNANVNYQMTEMGKVDQGGGGTIAYIMANYGMNVIDAGVPVLNMHAPWEITSKADIYETYKCYKAFYNFELSK
ncbi:MAG: aminopeptidase [Clostridia bacterium]|nr:aminopeptidase [Clostridia bacterium]